MYSKLRKVKQEKEKKKCLFSNIILFFYNIIYVCICVCVCMYVCIYCDEVFSTLVQSVHFPEGGSKVSLS